MEFFRGVACLLLFSTCGYVLGQSPKAKLSITPNKGIILGVNATLTCKVSGKGFLDIVRITHIMDDEDIVIANMLSLNEDYKDSGRYETTLDEESSTATLKLFIYDVQKSDLGKYQCLLLGDAEYSDSGWLMRERPPTPVKPPKNGQSLAARLGSSSSLFQMMLIALMYIYTQ